MRARLAALVAAALIAVPTQMAAATDVPDPVPTTSEPTTSEPTTSEPTTSEPTAEPPTYVETTTVIGTTAKGRDITAYFQVWTGERTGPTLLVLGQMHGDEKAGKRTISWLRKHPRPAVGSAVWLIPTMNPDSDARGTRTNARGVDLNRNWPTTGWRGGGKGSRTWGGPRKGSEREVKAMMTFLDEQKPDYIVSLHQPYGVVGKANVDKAFEKRLSKNLGLKLKSLGVGTPSGKISPTLTGWYNRYHREDGVAITVEYRRKVSDAWAGAHAGNAVADAARVR